MLDEPLTVLFGRSGLGKSSLLRAGLFPLLREKGFVPIYVRLHLHAAAAPLSVQVRAFLEDELRANSIECPEWPEDESLWQYLHRTDFELWTTSNRLVRPVLVSISSKRCSRLAARCRQRLSASAPSSPT